MKKAIFKRGDPVAVELPPIYPDKTSVKIIRLYEFGYYTGVGCVVYKRGERNMQDSLAFNVDKIKNATKEDLENYYWG